MSRTETFWKPCRANSRSAALNTACLVAAWASSVSSRWIGESVMRIREDRQQLTRSARLPGKLLHRFVEPVDGEWEHPVAHQLLHHPNRGRVVPVALGGRVQPD